MAREIAIRLVDTPTMRSILRDLAAHAAEDEAESHEDSGDIDKADACRAFDDAVTRALIPQERGDEQ